MDNKKINNSNDLKFNNNQIALLNNLLFKKKNYLENNIINDSIYNQPNNKCLQPPPVVRQNAFYIIL